MKKPGVLGFGVAFRSTTGAEKVADRLQPGEDHDQAKKREY